MFLPRQVYPEQSRRGFYHPITVLILAAITLSIAVIFFLNSNVLFKNKENPPQLTPSPISKSSPSPASDQTANTDPIGEDWKTYTSTNYSFSYPPNLKVNPNNSVDLLDENGKLFLSIYSFDPAVVGISYCAVHSNDKPNCEQLKVGDKIATIDWNIDTDGKANAVLGNLSINLNMTDNQAKKLFKQILSTFQFLD